MKNNLSLQIRCDKLEEKLIITQRQYEELKIKINQ